MRRLCARGAAVFCFAFALFQQALALGAPFGDMVWGGSSPVLPETLRHASQGAAAYLAFCAAMMLGRASDWGRSIPGWLFLGFNALLTIQLALNTLANLAARSDAERYGMGAATLVGFLLCVGALLPERKSPS